jgi:hypothetical protein
MNHSLYGTYKVEIPNSGYGMVVEESTKILMRDYIQSQAQKS